MLATLLCGAFHQLFDAVVGDKIERMVKIGDVLLLTSFTCSLTVYFSRKLIKLLRSLFYRWL